MISSSWHPLDRMIRSPMDRMIRSPVDRMISSPVEASYPCSLRLMGSTSHLINEQGNDDREHSSIIDRRNVVSTVLPMLG